MNQCQPAHMNQDVFHDPATKDDNEQYHEESEVLSLDQRSAGQYQRVHVLDDTPSDKSDVRNKHKKSDSIQSIEFTNVLLSRIDEVPEKKSQNEETNTKVKRDENEEKMRLELAKRSQ